MAEPIVSFLLETIGKLLIEEGQFLSGVSDEAERLHSELKMMRALLKDADGKQHEAAIVREWVSQSRDLAYEAENVLEDYAFKLATRSKKKGTLSMVKRLVSIFKECCIRHNAGSEIQSINTRISDLTRRFQEYGIRAAAEGEGSSSSARQQQLMMRMTYSYVANDEDFVGFGDDVAKLVEVLAMEGSSLYHHGVVSICGMGGSGKTTLARKVFNHRDVKSHFDSFAWVCISQQWRTRDILQGILVSFLPDRRNEIEKWRDDEIVEQLVRIQEDEKCLVVLDDIWSADAWECIKFAFPLRKKGNKILITTRNKDVATQIGPNGYHHQPKLLTDAESLELLMKKAIRDRPNQEYENIQNLKVLGMEIVKTCGGLPLAVVVLGGILASKHNSTEWNAVHKNIRSYLGKGERIEQNQGEVQYILALSYSDLPYKLKPCFLYLSVFSEDEEIEVDKLYNLWVAEGMVSVEDRISDDESMKGIAERYLRELARRCIVTVRYSSCHLHDLMGNLCKSKAREEHFLKVLDYGHGNDALLANSISSSAGNNIPRVMISLSPQDTAKYAPSIQMEASKTLRTLVFCATKSENLMAQLAQAQIHRFKMLRSLIIERVTTPGAQEIRDENKIPDDVFELPICKLIHLRYLRLSNLELVMSPRSITNLEHLEILDLRGSRIIWAKNIPIKTRKLKHLYLPSHSNIPMQIYVSNDVEVIYGLVNNCFEVKNLSELTNVRELGPIQIGMDTEEVKGIEEIFKCISNSHHLKAVAIILVGVHLVRQERSSELLGELFRSNVQFMFLNGRLPTLPEYDSHFLMSLVSLILNSNFIEENPMKILEKLPNLENLEFRNHAFVGKELICHSMGFPRLTFLLLEHSHELETWIVEKGAMPNLSHLQISCCEILPMIPEAFRFITALKELVLEGMPEEFVSRNINNFRHVPSIVIDGTRKINDIRAAVISEFHRWNIYRVS